MTTTPAQPLASERDLEAALAVDDPLDRLKALHGLLLDVDRFRKRVIEERAVAAYECNLDGTSLRQMMMELPPAERGITRRKGMIEDGRTDVELPTTISHALVQKLVVDGREIVAARKAVAPGE